MLDYIDYRLNIIDVCNPQLVYLTQTRSLTKLNESHFEKMSCVET